MLNKLFGKTRREDPRVHYRRNPGKGAALGVKLICSNGAPVAGTIADLSAGGTAIEFDDDLEAELPLDAVREIVFSSLTVSSVRASAIVRMVPTERSPKRYGFQFMDAGAVFEQLDDSFYKYFNRRQFRRAKPALGEKIKAELLFGNVAESVQVYDLSMGGASFYVPEDIAQQLEIDMPVEVTVHVPKTQHELVHYALIRHITPDNKGFRVGVSMEVQADGSGKRGVKKARTAYADYIDRRIAEMDRYNSAYN